MRMVSGVSAPALRKGWDFKPWATAFTERRSPRLNPATGAYLVYSVKAIDKKRRTRKEGEGWGRRGRRGRSKVR